MVLYGPSGVGKSSLAAEFENCVFVTGPHEQGINDLIEFGQSKQPLDILTATGWEHLLKTTEKLSSRKGVDTVAYDSTSEFQRLCFAYHCAKYYNNDWSAAGFYSYQSGPKNAAQRDWPEFITALENLRLCGKNVILIGHSQIKPFKNPGGADYDRFVPALEKEIWGATHQWATAVIFYQYHVETSKEGGRFKGKSESQTRQLCCVHEQAKYDAKNRYGLPPVILAGDSSEEAYTEFMKHYNS